MESTCQNCRRLKQQCAALDYILCRFIWHDGVEDDLHNALYDPNTFILDGKDPFLGDALHALNGQARFIREDEELVEMSSEEIDEARKKRRMERQRRHREWIVFRRHQFNQQVEEDEDGDNESLQELD